MYPLSCPDLCTRLTARLIPNLRRVDTEVWTLDDLGNSVIEPSLSGDARAYIYNPPMFAVDFEFCKT